MESTSLFDLKNISKRLTNKEREVIKLLQNKEVIITNKKKVLVTCGNDTKKVSMPVFYNLVNKGLVYHQTEWPFSYVLSSAGKIIKT